MASVEFYNCNFTKYYREAYRNLRTDVATIYFIIAGKVPTDSLVGI